MVFAAKLHQRLIAEEKLQIFGLFLIVLIIRVVAFIFSKNYTWDSVERVILAQRWLENPFLITDAKLPQQHTIMPIYLVGIGMGIWNNPLITPRFVNLIIGSLTIFPFFLLVKLLFDKRTAIYSALFFSFFTLHVRSSVIASSEAPFIFFLLFSLFFLFKFKSSGKIAGLICSALFLNLACMTRYNGWMYIPLLCLLLPKDLEDLKNTFLLKGKTKYHILIFAGISLVFPVSWMIGNYMAFGDPLYPIHISTDYTLELIEQSFLRVDGLKEAFGFRFYYLAFWPAVVFLSMTPVIAIFSFSGVIYSIYRRKHLSLILLSGAIYLWFTYKIMTKTFILMPRFTMDPSILVLPFAVIGMDKFLSHLDRAWRRLLAGLIALGIITSLFFIIWASKRDATTLGSRLSEISPVSRLATFQEDIISFLNDNTGPEDRVVIDHDSKYAENEIMFYSDLDMKQFIAGFENFQSREKFSGILISERPKYVIYSTNGHLPGIWDTSSGDAVEGKYGLSFKLVYTADPYLIYEVYYEDFNKHTLGER